MKLMVIDGNSLLNRAFYGIRPLTTREGLNTNAVYGFLNILLKLLDSAEPDGICVCFDLRAPTFRHLEYDGYKASRKGMPEELAEQVPVIKEVLDKMGVHRLELEGFEADDLIGTTCRLASEAGWEAAVVTGDRDSLQLISPTTTVLLITTAAGRTDTVTYDVDRVVEKYGISPEAMIELKGLMGDKSDDIPGVAGVGEKTALDLVRKFGSIENIYQNLDTLDIRDSLREKLRSGRETAFLSKRLATIDCRAPVDFSPEQALRRKYDGAGLFALFQRLEFNRLIERMKLYPAQQETPAPAGYVPPPFADILDRAGLESLTEELRAAEFVSVACSRDFSAVAVGLENKTCLLTRKNLDDGVFDDFLRFLFSDEVKKVTFDQKNLIRELKRDHLPTEGFVFDAGLAAYVLNATDPGFDPPGLSKRELDADLPPESVFSDDSAFTLLDTGGARDALCLYASAARALKLRLEPLLNETGAAGLYNSVELPLCAVLADMEAAGFLVDETQLRKLGAQLSSDLESLEGKIFELAGRTFNINSTRQLGELLFKQLGLPVVKKTKTGVSTDIEVLERLRGEHPIVEELIEYRSLSKLKSTYVDGLAKVIAPDRRIHTCFNMTATATGRLSSTDPNLQNIPIRQKRGSEIRGIFTAPEGWTLVDADYSQIELRVLAHIAGDEVMTDAFANGEDIHTITASQVFGVDPRDVTSLMRRHAKAVNFGIVYGISEFSLAQDIGVPRPEARRYMDAYFAKYSGVRAYMTDIVERAKSDGYVTTLLGRRRYLPELHSKNHNIRAFGERVALNAPIQGTAADIIKIAMLRVWRSLKQENLRARLILQVHDELLLETPEDECDKVRELVKFEMENAFPEIRLDADVGAARNWRDAKG
ncbi:DNA polymerase [Clostridia bacterium]|nr:DNA polymerase [Clostridia bacterium]